MNSPELETERLRLRRFVLEDADAFYNIINNREINRFLPLLPFDSLKKAKDHLQRNYISSYQKAVGFKYAICLKTDNIPIGYIAVKENDSYDIGYGLKNEYWHQGIVTEAGLAVVKQLKKAGVPYITATHDVNNPRSGNVMKKIGMTYRYTYEELWQPKNILVTFRMYQLNLDGQDDRVYLKYWDRYQIHYVENL